MFFFFFTKCFLYPFRSSIVVKDEPIVLSHKAAQKQTSQTQAVKILGPQTAEL